MFVRVCVCACVRVCVCACACECACFCVSGWVGGFKWMMMGVYVVCGGWCVVRCMCVGAVVHM